MGIVFGLLAVLWLPPHARAALRAARAQAAAPAGRAPAAAIRVVDPAAEPAAPVVASSGPRRPRPRLVAAITVAVLRHAEARRRQAAPAMRSYWPGSLLFASRWVAAGRMRQGQSWRRRAR